MAKARINCTGYHENRIKREDVNRAEAIFAALWKQWNTGRGTALIAQLRSEDSWPADTTDAEQRMAATVIQWLGSNVGQDFLQEAAMAGALRADVAAAAIKAVRKRA